MTNPEPVSERRAIAMAFLQRVLPSRGMYFAATKLPRARGVKRQACATLTELWGELSSSITDTYFATASFKDNTSSTAVNIEALQSLRLDVDCSPKELYSNAQAGMVAVLRFSQAAGLPPPGFVKSGRGVHAWWPLTSPLSRSAWERYADGLKRACKAHGLAADPVCTTDAARVLRCPGTFNCKTIPTEVELHDLFFKCGPYDIALFDVLVESNVVTLNAHDFKGSDGGPLPGASSNATLYCPVTVKHYASALSSIPLSDREDRQIWFETGAALHELGWGENGFRLWCLWSSKSAKYDEADQAKTWASFERPYDGPKITPGSLVHRAQQHGWAPPVDPPEPVEAGVFSENPEPAANHPVQLSAERLKKEKTWQLSAAGRIKDHNYQNCRIALATLGLRARHNVFIDKKDAVVPWLGQDWVTFSDDLIAPIRKHILDLYKFDPGKECVVDVLEEFAIDGAYDPVVNYLSNLEWDRVERLQTWLIDYLGAEDNELNRCFGMVTLVAAVRRALHPGAKFDHMLTLEGKQGTGKSTVVEILGLKEYYKNQTINFQDPKSIIEALSGAWFYEWAELAGMRTVESNRLKAMLSTAVDSARMAYGRMVKVRPRRTVIIGTTNAVHAPYLSDLSGGRRYWPVETNRILLNDLRRDIDQLYAEAVTVELSHGPLTVPDDLVVQAVSLQKSRTQMPTWIELLCDIRGEVFNEGTPMAEERVATKDVITQWLKLTASQMNSGTYKLISDAMRELGWSDSKVIRFGDNVYRGYRRRMIRNDNDQDQNTRA